MEADGKLKLNWLTDTLGDAIRGLSHTLGLTPCARQLALRLKWASSSLLCLMLRLLTLIRRQGVAGPVLC